MTEMRATRAAIEAGCKQRLTSGFLASLGNAALAEVDAMEAVANAARAIKSWRKVEEGQVVALIGALARLDALGEQT